MYALKEFPRLTISSMYIFHYDDVFLPFIHITCPVNQTAVTESMTVQYVSMEVIDLFHKSANLWVQMTSVFMGWALFSQVTVCYTAIALCS